MAATAIATRPVMGQCYVYLTGDTVDDYLAGNSTSLPLSNAKDPILNNRGQTLNATDPGGLKGTLTSQINVFAVEVANTGGLTDEGVNIQLFSDAAWVTTTAETLGLPQRPEQIWTGHTGVHLDRPIRSNLLIGYDTLDGVGQTGPTPASPPDVATVACQSFRAVFAAADPGRNEWQAGFVGLGVNGFRLPALYQSSVQWEQIPLKWGDGYRWTVTWPQGGITPQLAQQISAIYAKSGRGTAPVFFFPCPGQRSAAGTISATETPPYLRGGLARFAEKPSATAQALWVDDWQNTNFRIVLETWDAP